MKLHLPKSLRRAVLSCLALAGSLSTTIGTGFIAGGAVTIAFVAQEARAVWAADSGTNGYIYWYSDSTTSDLVLPTSASDVSNSGYATNPEAWTKFFICGSDNTLREGEKLVLTLNSITGADGVSVAFDANPWNANQYITDVTIDNLFGHEGTGSLKLLNDKNTETSVTVNQVTGVLSGAVNIGTMNIGTEQSTTILKGSLLNSGTMVLKGTFGVDCSNVANYVLAEESTNNAIVWSDAANSQGIKSVAGKEYLVLSDSVDVEGAVFTEATIVKETWGWVYTAADSEERLVNSDYSVHTADVKTSRITDAEWSVLTGFEISSGKKLIVDDLTHGVKTVKLSDDGILVLSPGKTVELGRVLDGITGGSLMISGTGTNICHIGNVLNDANMTVDGATLTIDEAFTNKLKGNMTITNKGLVKVQGGLSSKDSLFNWESDSKVEVLHDSVLDLADSRWSINNASSYDYELYLSDSKLLGKGDVHGVLDFISGGAVKADGNSEIEGLIRLRAGEIELNVDGENSILTISRTHDGGALKKTGSGKLVVTEGLDHSGNTTIESGTLEFATKSDKQYNNKLTISDNVKLLHTDVGVTTIRGTLGSIDTSDASKRSIKNAIDVQKGVFVAAYDESSVTKYEMKSLSLSGGGSFLFFADESGKALTVNNIDVGQGGGEFGTFENASCFNVAFKINEIVGTDTKLRLVSGAKTNAATIFDLAGESTEKSFSGTIELYGKSAGFGSNQTKRNFALNITDGAKTSKSVIATAEYVAGSNFPEGRHRIGIGINDADGVTVAGLQSTGAAEVVIFSGAAAVDSNTSYTSDTTVRTLTINTAENAYYVTDATVLGNLNLVKNGEGHQHLSGDLSQFNGSITINEGVLTLSGISASSLKMAAAGTLGLHLKDTAANALTLSSLAADSSAINLQLRADTAGTYTAIGKADDWAGLTTDKLGNIQYVLQHGLTASHVLTENGELQITVTGEAKVGNLTWNTEGSSNNWALSDDKNWNIDGADALTHFCQSDNVTFNGNGEKVTILGNVAATGINVTGVDWEWSGDGSVSSSGALTIDEGGELTISSTGIKTFTEGVTLKNGATLIVENDDGWSGVVRGIDKKIGTLVIATGKYHDTTGSKDPSFTAVIGADADEDLLNTLRFSNGTGIKLTTTGPGEWEWLRVADTLEIVDGAHVEIAATSHDYRDSACAATFRLSGAGKGEVGTAEASALALTHSMQTGFNSSLELLGDATIYLSDGVTASFRDGISGADHTLTKTGAGKFQIHSAQNLGLDIYSGTVEMMATDAMLNSVTGSGTLNIASGTTNLAATTQFDGIVNLSGGNLNIISGVNNVVNALTFVGGAGSSSNLNIKSGASFAVSRAQLGDVVNSTVNVEAGGALNIVGSSSVGITNWEHYKSYSTFLLTHWNCDVYMNINGTFNMLNNQYISAVDVVSYNHKAVINIEEGGVMNAKGIELVGRDGSSNSQAIINVKYGATLNLGSAGLGDKLLDSRTLEETVNNTLTFNLNAGEQGDKAGATLGILEGAEKWSTERNLSWTGDVTFNTQGYKVADNGIGGTRENGTAGTIELKGGVSGGIIKDGIGELELSGDVSGVSHLKVNTGTVSLETLSSTGRDIELAGGTTLDTALTLNGGSLTLSLAGTAASMGDEILTLGQASGTTLNLTLLDDAKVGDTFTLLKDIDSLADALADGAKVSDYFTMGTITVQSATGTALADDSTTLRPDITAERLGASALIFDTTTGELKITLAAAELEDDPLYWEPNATGDGKWSGSSWSGVDYEDDPKTPIAEPTFAHDPGVIKDEWCGDVVFTGDGAADAPAKVTVDTDAVVSDMIVANGYYTFAQDTVDDGNGGTTGVDSLTIQDKLTIGDATKPEQTASAILNMAVKVTEIELASGAASLTVNEAFAPTKGDDGKDVPISLTATKGGAIINGIADGTNIVFENAIIGGTAEKLGTDTPDDTTDDGIAINHLKLGIPYTIEVDENDDSEHVVTNGGGFTFINATITGAIDNGTVVDDNGMPTDPNTMGANVQFIGTTVLDRTAMGDLISDEKVYYYNYIDGQDVARQDNVANGYVSYDVTAQIFTNPFGVISLDPEENPDAGNTWIYEDGSHAKLNVDKTTGEIVFTGDSGTHYMAADETVAVEYDASDYEFAKATDLVLNGGDIVLNTGLDKSEGSKLTGGIRAEQDGTVTISEGVTLEQADLNANGNIVTLLGSGIYDLAADTMLGTGVGLGADDAETTDVVEPTWTGTVTTTATAISDISALGNENSIVDLTGDVVTESLTTGTVGKVTVKSLVAGTLEAAKSELSITGATTLKKDSTVGTAAFNGGLTLGTKDAAANLKGGELTLSTLNLANLDSTVEAARLSKDSLDIRIDKSLLSKLKQGDYRTLVTLWDDDSLAALSFNGDADGTLEEKGAKYLYSIGWEEAEPVAPLATDDTTAGANGEGALDGTVDNVLPPADVVVLTTVQNPNYMKEKYSDMSENALAGAELLDDAFIQFNPQENDAESDIASIIDAVDNNNISQDDLAAVAGSSIATLGMALSGDVERQLRAIRNRTTSMGVNECVVNEGMPYFNAWVNAEGNRAELDKDETLAGYTLDSWGGTIGFDVDLNPNLTVGMAITAMYGDLQADGPETKAEGDMDTYYVSLFARYASCAWTHTFVATLGIMDGSFDRTVSVGNGYETEGTTDGMSFGLMYEVGYVMPLDEDATACLQPVFNVMLRHSTVGSYTEEGGDAALDVESQSMTTLTFGLGARLQAVVGESVYNRASIFEARVLGKVDVGDRESEADVAFAGGSGHSATVKSAELGAFGVELGAGLTIPMGDDDGSIFVDGSVEMRSGYTNFNGTVGYRINF